MVEIIATEQNIEKRMRRNEGSLRDSWTTLNTPVFALLGYQKEKQEKGTEKILEEIIAENFLNVRKEIINQVQEAQRVPRQEKENT